MSNRKLDLIKKLVQITSPSENMGNVIQFVENYYDDLNVETKRNRKGGLIATLLGENDDEHRMLTAHVDTLGAMVKEIKSNGRLKLDLIGGFRYNSIEGEYCEIETSSGAIHTGTILMRQTSVHVYEDAGTAKRNKDNMEVRIDAKVSTADEVTE